MSGGSPVAPETSQGFLPPVRLWSSLEEGSPVYLLDHGWSRNGGGDLSDGDPVCLGERPVWIQGGLLGIKILQLVLVPLFIHLSFYGVCIGAAPGGRVPRNHGVAAPGTEA